VEKSREKSAQHLRNSFQTYKLWKMVKKDEKTRREKAVKKVPMEKKEKIMSLRFNSGLLWEGKTARKARQCAVGKRSSGEWGGIVSGHRGGSARGIGKPGGIVMGKRGI